jgi:hypothetical protein
MKKSKFLSFLCLMITGLLAFTLLSCADGDSDGGEKRKLTVYRGITTFYC